MKFMPPGFVDCMPKRSNTRAPRFLIALAVKADSMSQSGGEPTASHSLSALAGFSSWKVRPTRTSGWYHVAAKAI